MKNKIKFILFTFMLLFLYACSNPFKLELEDNNNKFKIGYENNNKATSEHIKEEIKIKDKKMYTLIFSMIIIIFCIKKIIMKAKKSVI